MKSRVIPFLLTIFGLYLIVSFSKDLLDLRQKGENISNNQLKLDQSIKENLELKKQLDEVKTPEFIEREARNKLGMSKPGEVVVILPKDLGLKKSTDEERDIPNWKKWANVFGF